MPEKTVDSNGFRSEIVFLDDQIQKAAEKYRDYLWNNDVQGQLSQADVPIPTVVEFSDGSRLRLDEWLKSNGAKCVLTDLGFIAGWLVMQRKGDLGWTPFWHSFKPQNAPHLALDPNDDKKFFLSGGSIKMTKEGVVD